MVQIIGKCSLNNLSRPEEGSTEETLFEKVAETKNLRIPNSQ